MIRRHYFAWVNGRYRLVLCIGAHRVYIPWRERRLSASSREQK